MNFSPFTQFAGIPSNTSLHQFTAAKFAQNITTADGQVSELNIFFPFTHKIIHKTKNIISGCQSGIRC